MLGPNIMWALAALRHAGESGDGVWLRRWLPKIRRAVGWVLSYAEGLPQCRFAAIPATAWPAGDEPDGSVSYCASHLAVPNATAPKLISAPGPLWNVPFDMKGNMSADSNAIAVILLRELADAEQFVANASGAATLRAAADTLSGALQALWRHDHFASQIGVDGGEKDWVDNDANFLAIAAGAATPTQAAAFAARFGRGMGGRCKRPTWVVERPPCGTGANGRRVECPDARVSEARVAWTEALARDAMGDTAALRTRLVEPLRTDVLRDTWLSERYSCDGAPIRTPYFFEYPSLLAILLREFHYGLRLRVGTVSLRPLLATPPFSWAVGSAVEILHRRHYVRLRVPLLVGDVRFTVGALCAGERYKVRHESGPEKGCALGADGAAPALRVDADGEGVARFTATVRAGCERRAVLVVAARGEAACR